MSQQGEQTAPIPQSQPPFFHEEQLLTVIANLQQQMSTMLSQQGESKIEVTRLSLLRGKMEEMSAFINAAQLYLRRKMTVEPEPTKIAWVLLYVQGGVIEA